MKFRLLCYGLALVAFAVMTTACKSQEGALTDVGVSPTIIKPNPDGTYEMARVTYKVQQQSQVSIYLTDASGKRYVLREAAERTPSPAPYELLLNGVSQGRLLPNGNYVWHVEADTATGKQAFTGLLEIAGQPVAYPKISEFTLSTNTISPNRDAIDDHVYINVVLAQQAKLNVYVVGQNGFRYEVQRTEGLRRITDEGDLPAGRYTYDYDGGIDLGADPPPDGDYILTAQTEDKIGQQDLVTASLTITQSGRPVAEIVTQPDGRSVEWSGGGDQVVRAPNDTDFITLGLSQTLYFTMAVRNVGPVPIRTGGPFDSKECYTMDQNLYSLGYIQEPGAFRVGVDYETNPGSDNPWRWGVGTLSDLDVVVHNGTKLYYLAPGKQVVVSGCIRLTKIPPRNPFYVYASLIQEDVEILAINLHVSPVLIQLVKP